MKKHLNEMQEYDKRMGVPDFNWTPEMEAEHYKKTQAEQLIIHGVSNRRELLLDFADLVMINDCDLHTKEERGLAVDKYLKGKL